MSSDSNAAPTSGTEHEPLLGRPGDVSQRSTDPILKNLVTGTAPLAQTGGAILAALVFGGVFTHKLLIPFSLHPLLNSFAVLVGIQAVLVLQPTHTAAQKRIGAKVHATFWATALTAFVAALLAVEIHKKRAGLGHFESWHAIVGVAAYTLLAVQATIGVTMYFFPAVYGSVDNAKGLYKYHRISGYTILSLLLLNVVLATRTFYGGNILGIKTWATVLGAVLVVAGVAPRIKKQKVRLWTSHS